MQFSLQWQLGVLDEYYVNVYFVKRIVNLSNSYRKCNCTLWSGGFFTTYWDEQTFFTDQNILSALSPGLEAGGMLHMFRKFHMLWNPRWKYGYFTNFFIWYIVWRL